MTEKKIKSILDEHEKWLQSGGMEGAKANFHGADLSIAHLYGADLRGADLSGATLHYADLRSADLRDANLCDADLHSADLRGADLGDAHLRNAHLRNADLDNVGLCGASLHNADLRGASLHNADLRYADLRNTDLRYADLDFSCLPLWCGSLNVKIDARLAAQLMYHCMRAMQSVRDDADVAKVLSNRNCIRLANRFHRIEECGEITKN